MSIVGIYPNWVPALTGPFPETNKNDRIIKTSNHLIVSIKLHVDLDVANFGYIVSFRNFGCRIINSFIVHVRPLSIENEALLK